MLHKNIRGQTRQYIPERTSSDARQRSEEHAVGNTLTKPRLFGSCDAGGSKDAQSHRIRQQHDRLKGRHPRMKEMLSGCQEKRRRDPGCHQRTAGIPEHSRRRRAKEQIPQHAAPAGSDQSHHADAEQIHLLLQAEHGPGHCKSSCSNQFQKFEKNRPEPHKSVRRISTEGRRQYLPQ